VIAVVTLGVDFFAVILYIQAARQDKLLLAVIDHDELLRLQSNATMNVQNISNIINKVQLQSNSANKALELGQVGIRPSSAAENPLQNIDNEQDCVITTTTNTRG
jgi:hypothetical protein